MKVLLTGAAGQLGQALRLQCPPGVDLIATARSAAGVGGGDSDGGGAGGGGVAGAGDAQPIALDLADADACRDAVHRHRPDWVLNAGAYTAVDRAESEADLAHAVNAGAPRAFAEALRETGGALLQLSTDFVFNGEQGRPYRPEQPRQPLGVYGASKAAGEEAVEQLLGGTGGDSGSRSGSQGLIVRTSWVIGPVGHNFARTMLRLHRERPEIAVVADQVGCPTSTATLAEACWRAITLQAPPSILHWSDAGAASWYDVAVAVGELALELGLLDAAARVRPISSADYPTPARRPSYSLLECSGSRTALGLEPLHWRTALRQVLAAL